MSVSESSAHGRHAGRSRSRKQRSDSGMSSSSSSSSPGAKRRRTRSSGSSLNESSAATFLLPDSKDAPRELKMLHAVHRGYKMQEQRRLAEEAEEAKRKERTKRRRRLLNGYGTKKRRRSIKPHEQQSANSSRRQDTHSSSDSRSHSSSSSSNNSSGNDSESSGSSHRSHSSESDEAEYNMAPKGSIANARAARDSHQKARRSASAQKSRSSQGQFVRPDSASAVKHAPIPASSNSESSEVESTPRDRTRRAPAASKARRGKHESIGSSSESNSDSGSESDVSERKHGDAEEKDKAIEPRITRSRDPEKRDTSILRRGRSHADVAPSAAAATSSGATVAASSADATAVAAAEMTVTAVEIKNEDEIDESQQTQEQHDRNQHEKERGTRRLMYRKRGAKRRRALPASKKQLDVDVDSPSASAAIPGDFGFSPPGDSPLSPNQPQQQHQGAPLAPKFKCTNRIREGHGAPVYCVLFNSIDERHSALFASAGANRVTVYRALEGGAVDPLQLYVDEDRDEKFYALAWSIDLRTGAALLLVAGEGGIIKVIDTHTRRVVRRLVGHGGSVNDLRIHPLDVNILLSVSKDGSCRLWNLTSGDCCAILAGDAGHRDEVLSGDWAADGRSVLTGGMDHACMVWHLDARVVQALRRSYLPSHRRPLGRPFPTVIVQQPAFSTARVHDNYVDHVRCLGNLCLSKSTEEKIVLWGIREQAALPLPITSGMDVAGATSPSAAAVPNIPAAAVTAVGSSSVKRTPLRVAEFVYSDCDIWYVRFAVDYPRLRLLAVGNKTGSIFVWRLDDAAHASASSGSKGGTVPIPPRKLTTPLSQRAVRCVSFSTDARVLIAACEDGSLFRWDQIERPNDSKSTGGGTNYSGGAAAAGAPSPMQI